MSALVIARNPNVGSRLPYLVQVPVRPQPLLLAVREMWPRHGAVFCYRLATWPREAEVLESVPLVSCRALGTSVEIVADRAHDRHSRFVVSIVAGKERIFWHSRQTIRAARPGYRLPSSRPHPGGLGEVVVDTRERYPYRFQGTGVTLRRAALAAGDYAVVDAGDAPLGVVERKTLRDLSRSLQDGSLSFQAADLATVPRAAIVVEGRYGQLLTAPEVRPGYLGVLIARMQVHYPALPMVFCETRRFAEHWTRLFLTTVRDELDHDRPLLEPAAEEDH